MSNDPVFDAVKRLEPPTVGPSPAAWERQRAAVMARSVPAGGGSGWRRGRRRFGRLGLAVGAVVSLGAGGAAAAAGLAGGPPPTPKQAATIYAHGYPDHGAGRVAGTRPTLNAEMVLCDYRGASGMAAADRAVRYGEGFASSAPLTVPLDDAMVVQACSKVDQTGDHVPAGTNATVCVTAAASTVTDTPAGWPAVVFGAATCAGSGDLPAPPDLLVEVNQRRNIEAAIDAIPDACPNEHQAVTWVRSQLHRLDLRMQVDPWPGGPTGRCYVPSVQWWSPPTAGPVVEVTASQQLSTPPAAGPAASASTTPTTSSAP